MATKMRYLLYLLLLFLACSPLPAQTLLNLPNGEGCNYDGSEPRQESVYSFAPSSQAQALIDETMNQVAPLSNFISKAANVPNTMAQVLRGQRCIPYDETFVEQTQPAMATLPKSRPSATHPPQSARMTAIAVGYRQVRGQVGGVQPQPKERQPSRQPGKAEARPLDTIPVPANNEVTLGGQSYRTVHLNGLTWLAENLNYDVGEGSWCYDDDPANCRKYGRLYNWEAAKKACQAVGWRMPTDPEWREMAKQFGGADDYPSGDGKAAYEALIEGGRSGFAAQLGGLYFSNGFHDLGSWGFYWSASKRPNGLVWHHVFSRSFGKLYRRPDPVSWGLSCRCVRD